MRRLRTTGPRRAPRWTASHRAIHDDERGAVLPMLALMLVLLLAAAAFAVDLGMQRVVARDMQAVADVVALDMARLLDGATTKAALEGSPAWSSTLAGSLARNDDNLGDLDRHVVEAGRLDQTTGAFLPIGGTEVPNAVRVTVEGSVGFAFAPATGGPDRGGATRSAIASAGPSGCFRLGSFALGLDTASSPLLGPILNDALNITDVGYEGLADATVGLGDLAAELGLGSPEELAATDASLAALYLASARVLQQQGDAATATVLTTIAAQVSSIPTIALGQLLALGQSGTVALDTQLNVLDLVSGSAFIANGTSAIAVPGLALALPGVTNLTVALRVIQKPVLACKDAVAETSQVQLVIGGTFGGSLPLLGVCLPIIGCPLPTITPVSGPLAITIDLATARGQLVEVGCTASPPGSMTVRVSDKAVARLGLSLQLSTLLGIPLAGVTATTTTGGAAPSTHVIDTTTFGPGGLTEPVTTGSGSLGLTPAQLQVQLLELTLLNDAGLVRTLLTPLLTTLDTALVNVIAPQLGLTLAGADVRGVERPSCAHPALRG